MKDEPADYENESADCADFADSKRGPNARPVVRTARAIERLRHCHLDDLASSQASAQPSAQSSARSSGVPVSCVSDLCDPCNLRIRTSSRRRRPATHSAHRRAGARFLPARNRRQDALPEGLWVEPSSGAHLHLQPLPYSAALRDPHQETGGRLQEPRRRLRRYRAEQPERRAPRRARLHRRERLLRGNESPRRIPALQFSLSLRRRHAEGGARLRTQRHAAPFHLRFRAQAALRGPGRQ